MKVFMIGGTGLLGCEAARIFIERGHQVKSVALPPLPEGAPIPEEMELEFCNIYEKSDDEIKAMMEGYDCFVFAAGIDERVEFPAPVYDVYISVVGFAVVAAVIVGATAHKHRRHHRQHHAYD